MVFSHAQVSDYNLPSQIELGGATLRAKVRMVAIWEGPDCRPMDDLLRPSQLAVTDAPSARDTRTMFRHVSFRTPPRIRRDLGWMIRTTRATLV
jgi:hypothetical protein